ncbi:hypothetical protein Pla123a_18350 [Posidoniimonas polymericola]|uniref:DUF4112 domain-containing protein n=1 Tax=Posidoniimonas polymericola TaxID=2528002 RepID=A0A5C5YSV2_9BACT|nr:DUF4112 domain-containing protein [Posidoniimonas polymericola]TWT78035.1 hypothetical protein Pla123a_18350 [Posidoniimonas polymericola]
MSHQLDTINEPGASAATEPVLLRLEKLSRLFDDAVRIPGTGIRLGWDAVIGLLPIGGDALTTLISAYYMWEARRLGARKRVLVKMLANSGIDFLVGAIPLVGDLADVAWRANRKNLRVLIAELEHLGKLPPDFDQQRLERMVGKRYAARESSSKASPSWASRPLMIP